MLANISHKGIKLACFVINEGSFQVRDMVHHFWQNCYEVHIFLDARVYQRTKKRTKNDGPEFWILLPQNRKGLGIEKNYWAF